VHPAARQQLALCRVDQRITGAADLPGGETGRCVVPAQFIAGRLVSPFDDGRAVPQNHLVKLAPDQFVEPGRRPPALCVQAFGKRRGRQLANRHRAETQVRRKIGHPADGREIARRVVVVDPRQEVRKQPCAAAHAGGQRQVGRGETELGQSRRWRDGVRNGPLPRRGVAVVRRKIGGGELCPPGARVGREHGIRRAGFSQYFVALEDHLILAVHKGASACGQLPRHRAIALQRGGLVIAIGIHGRHAERRRQPGNLRDGAAVADDQAAAVCPERIGKFQDRAADEVDAPLRARPVAAQQFQNVAVENENAEHPRMAAQGLRQGGMIEVAQIAPEPDQRRGMINFLH